MSDHDSDMDSQKTQEYGSDTDSQKTQVFDFAEERKGITYTYLFASSVLDVCIRIRR